MNAPDSVQPTYGAIVMHTNFWLERWAQKQIGFHQETTHPLLLSHWAQLSPREGEGVFVPLCGKTHDMTWLRDHGHPVVGVELSPLAVEQYFAEAALEPVS